MPQTDEQSRAWFIVWHSGLPSLAMSSNVRKGRVKETGMGEAKQSASSVLSFGFGRKCLVEAGICV